jgi:hypothetical protein
MGSLFPGMSDQSLAAPLALIAETNLPPFLCRLVLHWHLWQSRPSWIPVSGKDPLFPLVSTRATKTVWHKNKQHHISSPSHSSFSYKPANIGLATKKVCTQTVQFWVQDVRFQMAVGLVIPNTAPMVQLLQAVSVTLKLDNQKKG